MADILSNLLVYLQFENDYTDSSGNGHNGTLSPAFVAAPTFAAGVIGQAMDFDIRQYIDLGNLDTGVAAITVAAWVKVASGATGWVVTKQYDGLIPFSLNVGGNGAPSVLNGFAFFDGGWHNTGIVNDFRGDGNWHHVCGTWDGTTLKYYVDGTLDSSSTPGGGATRPTNTQSTFVGRYANDAQNITAWMDEFRIYARALTATDVAALAAYTGGSGPAAYTLALTSGAYTLTGQAVALKVARKLTPAAGAYVIGGQAVGLKVARKISLATGSFSRTGMAVGLKVGRRIALASGSFAWNGIAVGLRVARKMSMAVGAYTLIGRAVGMTYSGAQGALLMIRRRFISRG